MPGADAGNAVVMLILTLPPTFWMTAVALAGLFLLIAFIRRLRWRPAFGLRFILAIIALLVILLPEKRTTIDPAPLRQVMILDQSDSISPEARGESRARARQWLDGGANRLVIVVGKDAQAVDSLAFPEVAGTSTNLAAAIDLAADFLGSEPGRIILATDGLADDPIRVKQSMESLLTTSPGLIIETVSLRENTFPTDIYTQDIYLPSSLWENTPFTALLPVTTFLPGDVTLSVSVNEMIALEETINLPAGQHLIPISLQTTVSEIMTISAAVNADGDPRPENNSAHAALRVFKAPRVLVVTEDAVHAAEFSQVLSGVGLDTDLMLPEDMPDSQSQLAVYQVIIVDNILAGNFSDGQFRALKDFVQQQGRGLIFTGGRNAFTLGGYKDTVIEPLLPVRLEPPPREQDSPLTLVLVIDRSASMDGARGAPNNQRPIALAREAALRSVETLGAEDYLGILSYNAATQWSLRLQQVGSGDTLQNAKNAMASITPSGGTAIYNALNTAITELIDSPASETRHIVLLSDGNDETPLDQYAALAEFARTQDITISTIALGVEADKELMALLATAGKGRYYPVLQPADLPRILIDETRAARDENTREGESRAVIGEKNHPILSSIAISEMPALLGYNALQSKADEGAEDVLLSANFDDPLMSVWRFGLGRVAAWMGDLGSEWATEPAAWEKWGTLWANLIRYTLPDPALGPGQVQVSTGKDRVDVITRITSAAGVPQNALPVNFTIADPDGRLLTYPLSQTGPGEYAVQIPAPAPGAYRGVVQYIDETGVPVEFAAPVVVNYPDEWQPATQGEGAIYGTLISWNELLLEQQNLGSITLSPNQTLQRLLIVLILIWPIEIAIRRRWLPWR